MRMRRRIRSAAFPVHRHAIPQVALDAGLVALSYFLAYRLRFDGGVPARYEDLFDRTITFAICGSVFTFMLFGLYRHWMRYSSQREYLQIAQAVAVSVFALVGYVAVMQPKLIFTPEGYVSVTVPTGVLVLFGLLMLVLVGAVRYAGLKEEYYLADFEPDRAVLEELGLDERQPIAVVRTPPAVSLYHRFENPLFAQVLDRLRGHQAVVLPRTPEQRAELDGFVVPERAIDAQSLIAYADLVISAGGTMNREAVALGTPVWTTFEGRMGAVDEALIAAGRLRRLDRAEAITLEKRPTNEAARIRRDPSLLADLLLSPVGGLPPANRPQP